MKIKQSIALIMSTCLFVVPFATTSLASSDDDKDYYIGDAYWDEGEEGAVGVWDEPEDNTSYKVQLYRGSTKVGSKTSVSTEHFDFSKLIVEKGTGTYHFDVYSSKGGEDTLVSSDDLEVDSDYKSDLKNYLNNKNNSNTNTSNSSGPNAKNGWSQSGGHWIYYENNTSVKSAWRHINNIWYHFNNSGYMETGWINDNGTWYYANNDGSMLSNVWLEINGLWYLLAPSGAMYANCTTPDGYNVGADGAWIH